MVWILGIRTICQPDIFGFQRRSSFGKCVSGLRQFFHRSRCLFRHRFLSKGLVLCKGSICRWYRSPFPARIWLHRCVSILRRFDRRSCYLSHHSFLVGAPCCCCRVPTFAPMYMFELRLCRCLCFLIRACPQSKAEFFLACRCKVDFRLFLHHSHCRAHLHISQGKLEQFVCKLLCH